MGERRTGISPGLTSIESRPMLSAKSRSSAIVAKESRVVEEYAAEPSMRSVHTAIGDVDNSPALAALPRTSASRAGVSSSTSSHENTSALTQLADDRFHFVTDRRQFARVRNQSVITRSQITSAWRARHMDAIPVGHTSLFFRHDRR